VRKSQASMLDACARRKARHDERVRSGAGLRPASTSTLRTEVAETVTPRRLSSPTIRLYPQCGFSSARRTISSRSERSIGGRPGARCAYVHRRPTSWRCQRSSVSGLTEKPAQAVRGSEQLSDANSVRSARVSFGRDVCRRRIASSCRRTRISSSFERRGRPSSHTSANRLRTTRYTNDQSKQPSLDHGKSAEPSEPRRSGEPRTSLRTLRGYTEQKMFGDIGFMIDGHIAVGVSGEGGLMIHCSKKESEALLAKPGARPFEMRGREGWLRVDAESVSTKRELEPWVMESVAFARALPPKENK
jgi:TfoX N-terminal domain